MMDDGEYSCDWSGRCVADVADDSTITSCVYCGKELVKIDGYWFTWDWEFVTNPQPQHEESRQVLNGDAT